MNEVKVRDIENLKELMRSNEVYVKTKDSEEFIRLYLIDNKIIMKLMLFGRLHDAEIQELEEESLFYTRM